MGRCKTRPSGRAAADTGELEVAGRVAGSHGDAADTRDEESSGRRRRPKTGAAVELGCIGQGHTRRGKGELEDQRSAVGGELGEQLLDEGAGGAAGGRGELETERIAWHTDAGHSRGEVGRGDGAVGA